MRCTLFALLVAWLFVATPASAAWRGFKQQQLIGNQYAVSYTPKTITAKVPNLMLFLIGSTGRLCAEKRFTHAVMSEIELGSKYQGIKQVSATVEFLHEETEESEPCEVLAEKPTNPKELKRYKKALRGATAHPRP